MRNWEDPAGLTTSWLLWPTHRPLQLGAITGPVALPYLPPLVLPPTFPPLLFATSTTCQSTIVGGEAKGCGC